MEERIAGFEGARAHAPRMSHVRSTWLLSSVLTLREHGHHARYVDALAPLHRDAILGMVAGSWVPVEVFAAHYDACDRLGLPEREQVEMGASVTRRLHGVVMSFGIRVVREAGVTPWAPLERTPALFQRVARGGAAAVYRMGPKEARVELLGYPVARSAYARLAMRGCLGAIVGLVAARAFVSDVVSLCKEQSLAYRVQWV